ncbi:MAG: MarR family transcriptional regulator [Rhizobiaceae bacterium]
MDSDDDSVPALAFELRETISRGIRRLHLEPGPPLSQLAVISRLRREGAQSTNELAAAERVRPQSMSITVGLLEKNAMIRRRPHPTDRRQMLIELTSKGLQALEDVYARREGWLTKVIAEQLNPDERRELQRGLLLVRRIIDA